MIEKAQKYIELTIEYLSITIVSIKDYSLNLGQLILAGSVLVTGVIIIRFLTRKISKIKFIQDINEQTKRIPLLKLFRFFLYALLLGLFLYILGFPTKIIAGFWKTSLFTINENSVTIGNLVIGITFFLFAVRINKVFKPRTEGYINRALDLDYSTQKTVSTIIEYVFILIIFLFALSIIGIPLTAFTVIGGSMAIGVGLGSQNLINNFISGFVLMSEGTTKIGDIIEIQDDIGTVEKIGFRSTVIKTFDNLRLIMPNSSLLENNVINWSLTDKILRRKVVVGVAYGADVVKVQELLLKCAKNRKDINDKPEPFIIFSDFGDSALIFDVYIYIDMTNNRSALKIESDLRTDIYQALAREKIGIPFPQRDNHIFIGKPIDVNVTQQNSDKKQEN